MPTANADQVAAAKATILQLGSVVSVGSGPEFRAYVGSAERFDGTETRPFLGLKSDIESELKESNRVTTIYGNMTVFSATDHGEFTEATLI